VRQALTDPQVLAREMVVEVPSVQWGTVRQTGNPIKVDRQSPRLEPAPEFGEHTVRVLREYLGYSAQQVERLREVGAI
jgi:crotonobetainyl-CoA:carnitine CoA-transferase CaiB-like acyl-CoA transferase